MKQELRDELAASLWSDGHATKERVADAVIKSGVSWYDAYRLLLDWGDYPTWEQLVELAAFCKLEPLMFTIDLP